MDQLVYLQNCVFVALNAFPDWWFIIRVHSDRYELWFYNGDHLMPLANASHHILDHKDDRMDKERNKTSD